MATVKWDTLRSSGMKKTREGTEFSCSVTVTGLTGANTPLRNEEAIVAIGLNLGSTFIDGSGNTFPYHFLEEIDSKILDDKPSAAEVNLVYRMRWPAAGNGTYNLEVGTAVTEVETTKDYQGNNIVVSFNGESRIVSINKPVAESTLIVRRLEVGSPGAKSRKYVGKVNSGPWSRDPDSKARQWFCTSIRGVSSDRVHYEVTYEFQQRDETWDQEAVFTDETGRVPMEVADNPADHPDAIKRVRLVNEIDFAELAL